MKLIESNTEMMEEVKDFIKENKLLSVILFITGSSYLTAFIVSVLNLIFYLL